MRFNSFASILVLFVTVHECARLGKVRKLNSDASFESVNLETEDDDDDDDRHTRRVELSRKKPAGTPSASFADVCLSNMYTEQELIAYAKIPLQDTNGDCLVQAAKLGYAQLYFYLLNNGVPMRDESLFYAVQNGFTEIAMFYLDYRKLQLDSQRAVSERVHADFSQTLTLNMHIHSVVQDAFKIAVEGRDTSLHILRLLVNSGYIAYSDQKIAAIKALDNSQCHRVALFLELNESLAVEMDQWAMLIAKCENDNAAMKREAPLDMEVF